MLTTVVNELMEMVGGNEAGDGMGVVAGGANKKENGTHIYYG